MICKMFKIPGFDGYLVNKKGDVFSARKKNLVKRRPQPDKDGYLKVVLVKNEGSSYINIARLVAMTFLPNPLNKPTVNHKNGVVSDNRLINLEWATRSEQALHRARVLKRDRAKGSVVGTSKLKESEVLKIRKLVKEGVSISFISKKFNINVSNIHYIKTRKTWRHI